MRLNEKTYPAYNALKHSLEELKLPTHSNILKTIQSKGIEYDFLKGVKDVYNQVKHRYYITKPFEDAVVKAFPKIRFNYLKYDKPDAGIIFNESGFTLYLVNPPDKKIKSICYGFLKTSLMVVSIVGPDDTVTGMCASNENSQDDINNFAAQTLAIYYFINECEIEEVIVPAGEKHGKAGSTQNLLNETKEDVTILDCKWFTDIIRDTPFLVNGHFRWQPVGPGRTKRKLIWISEFQKDGYHLHAKKS